jgi:hypothetical protein
MSFEDMQVYLKVGLHKLLYLRHSHLPQDHVSACQAINLQCPGLMNLAREMFSMSSISHELCSAAVPRLVYSLRGARCPLQRLPAFPIPFSSLVKPTVHREVVGRLKASRCSFQQSLSDIKHAGV